MAELAAIAAVAALASSAVTAVGTIAAGKKAKEQSFAEASFAEKQGRDTQQAAEFEAAQLDIAAKNERATSQREMEGLRRQKRLALSTLQARAAGSGFTATDPTSLSIADEIEKYGTLQEQTALYGGSARGDELNLNAAARRFSGDRAVENALTQGSILRAGGRTRQTASYFSAGGTILGGVSSFATKYGAPKKIVPTTTGRYG